MESPREVCVTVNGRKQMLPAGTSLAELLQRLNAPVAEVAVELDGEVVKREEFPSLRLTEGQRLEIVRLVGGG